MMQIHSALNFRGSPASLAMQTILILCLLSLILMLRSTLATAAQPSPPTFLLPDAPSFNLTIPQFRAQFNQENAAFSFKEFRVINDPKTKAVITTAVSVINDSFYSSAALVPSSGKIKSLQLTWLLNNGKRATKQQDIIQCIASLIQFFTPQYNQPQSVKRAETLLSKGKGHDFSVTEEGAIRYIIADTGNNSLTFAIEPVRLTMNPKTGLDKPKVES